MISVQAEYLSLEGCLAQFPSVKFHSRQRRRRLSVRVHIKHDHNLNIKQNHDKRSMICMNLGESSFILFLSFTLSYGTDQEDDPNSSAMQLRAFSSESSIPSLPLISTNSSSSTLASFPDQYSPVNISEFDHDPELIQSLLSPNLVRTHSNQTAPNGQGFTSPCSKKSRDSSVKVFDNDFYFPQFSNRMRIMP